MSRHHHDLTTCESSRACGADKAELRTTIASLRAENAKQHDQIMNALVLAKDMSDRASALEVENVKLREALEAVRTHVAIAAGSMARVSATWRIANDALEKFKVIQ